MPSLFLDTPENLHPYECNGPGQCMHCDRRFDEDIHMREHDPATCSLCDPDYDGQPNPHWQAPA